MKITPAEKTDYGILRTLFLQERRSTFYWLDPSVFQLKDFDTLTKGETILVARIGETVVGFISIWMKSRFIHHLYVDQDHQSKGIGSALLKAAIQITDLPITLKCLENNSRAVIFYQQKGFSIKERGLSEHGPYILFELTGSIK
ncbi:GNAT family N-acetyltransferase [Flavobacterium tructae]|uniref:GNAT family N-acetyltransferase n=1 Tax=Flavobacterium tructae TaxID=1114873 RepID=UPI000B5BEE88|nr:GNAT family N-acetyltransferase [Flavobacterium tructae]OXB24815.1 GNAT family N-acetyltransferase [Flavobacterium tructae]